MPFITFFITIILAAKNCFSRKCYQALLVNDVIIINCINPEIVIHDYTFYVLELLKKSALNAKKKCIVFYECNTLSFLEIILPSVRVFLQIEHTLVKPGGRDSYGAPSGALKVAKSETHYLVRIAKLLVLNKADLIIDYSRINLHNIRASRQFQHYLKKAICVSPALYDLNISTQDRQGIITLFGNPKEPRRKAFLESLGSHQIETRNIQGIYFDIDSIYRKAKIVINIRQTEDHDTLEELRVLPALRCGAIVICETAPFIEKTWYSQFLICGTLTEIPQLIMDVEKNYNDYHARIFGYGPDNTRFIRRMKRIERCNQLSVNKAIQELAIA